VLLGVVQGEVDALDLVLLVLFGLGDVQRSNDLESLGPIGGLGGGLTVAGGVEGLVGPGDAGLDVDGRVLGCVGPRAHGGDAVLVDERGFGAVLDGGFHVVDLLPEDRGSGRVRVPGFVGGGGLDGVLSLGEVTGVEGERGLAGAGGVGGTAGLDGPPVEEGQAEDAEAPVVGRFRGDREGVAGLELGVAWSEGDRGLGAVAYLDGRAGLARGAGGIGHGDGRRKGARRGVGALEAAVPVAVERCERDVRAVVVYAGKLAAHVSVAAGDDRYCLACVGARPADVARGCGLALVALDR